MSERAQYWTRMLGAWEQSGLSQLEFCRREGINAGTFAWWKRQLRKARGDVPRRQGQPRKAAGRFVEVRLTNSSLLSTYEVVLPRGRSIRVPSQFDAQVLSRLIAAVESC
jgi:transposase-like protein